MQNFVDGPFSRKKSEAAAERQLVAVLLLSGVSTAPDEFVADISIINANKTYIFFLFLIKCDELLLVSSQLSGHCGNKKVPSSIIVTLLLSLLVIIRSCSFNFC